MRKSIILLFAFLLLISCRNRINLYVKDENDISRRNGKWKEEYSSDEGALTATGRYRNGEKIGTWKTVFDKKKYQKDIIRKDITKTKKYYPNGKIMEKGQSKLEISDRERHWFYFGPWKFYDGSGKLLYIKNYRQGQKTDSISMIRQSHPTGRPK
jgi:antitoxin component YwqK of YwqJK toxin-antitoxin module